MTIETIEGIMRLYNAARRNRDKGGKLKELYAGRCEGIAMTLAKLGYSIEQEKGSREMEEEVTLEQVAEVVFAYLISWKVQLGQIREQDARRALDDALANWRRRIEKDGVAK